MRDARLEAGQRGHEADHLLVGGVARVDDPVVVPVPAEDLERGPAFAAGGGRRAQAPRGAAEGLAGQAAVEAWPEPGCSRRSARGRPRRRRAGPAPRRVRARGYAACTSGCRPARIRATGSRTWRTAEANAATRTVPAGAADGSRSRRAASIAARTVTAWPASRRPAGVSRTRRPSGSISGVPASRARTAICCETVEVVMCIASPTSRIEPRRDSSSSSSRRRGSTSQIIQYS